MGDYEVDTSALDAAAEAMLIPAETLRAALTRFQADLTLLGAPWGDDDMGRQWAEKYLPGLENLLKGLGAAPGAMEWLSAQLRQMSVGYTITETKNAH